MPLPAPLQALSSYPHFVAVKLTPDEAKPGKLKKLPINPHTLTAASSTDRATWGTYEDAAKLGLPVGFVLTESDPFFCLDIDGALQQDGTWSPLAHELLAAFPGAAVEISSSGKGLHIWGTASTMPAHKCKNIGLGIELYHRERFIALGMPGATGDAFQDFAPHVANVAARYFPVSYASATGGDPDWSDVPCDAWRGSTDDSDLIRRMLKSESAAGVFGGGTFADLWTADTERLTLRYPDTTSGVGYDASSADRALAQHLAFWTGKDCERIERLMRQSKLVREKWEREAYMRMTILSAVRDCHSVCVDSRPAAVETLATQTNMTPIGGIRASVEAIGHVRADGAMVHGGEMATVFKGCVYLKRQDRAFVPGDTVPLKPAAFRFKFGGNMFIADEATGKMTNDAWDAWTNSKMYRAPEAAGTCFRPDLPHGHLVDNQGEWFVNTYLPAEVACVEGDVSLFTRHMEKLLPNERDRNILVSYMAAVVQYPGRKFSWAPVIQGTEGNGKTLMSEVLSNAVGHKYTARPNKKQLEKEFNSWMADKLFVAIEDITVKRDLLEEFKTIITGKVAAIELKGVDAEMREVCCNFMFNCNPKDGVPKTTNDRRYAPFFTAQQCKADLTRDGMDGVYFQRLYGWLNNGGYGNVTHFLRTYQIPDELNPATLAQRAPDTSSTHEAISVGLGAIEQEVMEAIERGDEGFRGGFVSSTYLGKLIETGRRNVALSRRRALMESLGYIQHPALTDGRTNATVHPDGAKPRLYVHRDNRELLAIAQPASVAKSYTDAQLNA